MSDLNALFDPEVSGHWLPVLWANNVQQPVEQTTSDACIKDFHELLTYVRLRTAKSTEERRLKLWRQLRVTKRIIPMLTTLHVKTKQKRSKISDLHQEQCCCRLANINDPLNVLWHCYLNKNLIQKFLDADLNLYLRARDTHPASYRHQHPSGWSLGHSRLIDQSGIFKAA